MRDVHFLELVTCHDKGKMEMQDVHLLELVEWEMFIYYNLLNERCSFVRTC